MLVLLSHTKVNTTFAHTGINSSLCQRKETDNCPTLRSFPGSCKVSWITGTRNCSAFMDFNRNVKIPGNLKEFVPDRNICKHNDNS